MEIPDTVQEMTHMSRPITPKHHAMLDYAVTATFIGMGFAMLQRNRQAAALAFLNGGMVAVMSMLTNYPGGVWPKISFKGHRNGDIMQAALAGLGPVLFGFSKSPEASYFYGQALSEVAVIAATDWDAGPEYAVA